MPSSILKVFLSCTFALALAGCGGDEEEDETQAGLDPSDGTPLGGDGAGAYGERAFSPSYAIAKERSVGGVVQELQFSEVPINCEHHLDEGVGNDLGLYLRVFLKSLEPGVHEDVFVEYDELHDSGTRQRFSSDGTVELTAVDDEMLAGNIQYQSDDDEIGTLSFEGSFEIVRCGDVD